MSQRCSQRPMKRPSMIDSGKLTAWYDFQAPFYSFWRDQLDSPLVVKVAEVLRAQSAQGRLLDAGCGTGLFCVGLARRLPGWQIHGVDASRRMLQIAERKSLKLGLKNLTFSQDDVTSLPFEDGHFDAAVAAGLFPNVNDHRAALRELHRTLRQGATLMVVEFDRMSMTRGTRLMFRTMIFGYKTISSMFPRFRFANNWTIETSTIDPDSFLRVAREVRFRERSVWRKHAHLVLEFVKGEDGWTDS